MRQTSRDDPEELSKNGRRPYFPSCYSWMKIRISHAMAKQLPEARTSVYFKNIWKRWKWIGLVLYAFALAFNRWLPAPLVAAAYMYGLVVIANLLFHLFRYLKNRLLWSVRNRLIGAFVFVGVIPLFLLLGVALLTGFVLFGQLAGRYLDTSLLELENQLTGINGDIAGRLLPSQSAADFAGVVGRIAAEHGRQFPRLAVRLLRKDGQGTFGVVSRWDPQEIEKEIGPYPAKEWLGDADSFQGLVRQERTLLMVSLQPIHEEHRLYLAVSAPLDRFIEERIRRENSIYFTLIGIGAGSVTISGTWGNIRVKEDDPEINAQDERAINEMETLRLSDPRRMIPWGDSLRCINYSTGKRERAGIAVLHVPLATVYDHSVGTSDITSGIFLKMIYGLGGAFVFVELMSLIVGFTISRRVTRSVHDIYQGMLALEQGDLQHRIPVRRKDQLGFLANSFNQMSASITRLLEEVSEKKRLEQELEIAREVQATLFPKQLPKPRGMTIFGGCEPARVVSGDYYDFIFEDEANLNIVLADISGKGISAALLMANLQAAMRNQLLTVQHESPAAIESSLALVMSQLNRQIYLNSPAEKYATLFLSRYSAETRRLYYCNAGHLPPVLLDEQGTHLLESTGMVVGLFPEAAYEARSVELTPGALVAIFTDGVTEAVNRNDEEFGEKRLIEALTRARAHSPEAIFRFVIERVREWQGDLPQHDDITLIIAKAG